VTNVATLLFAFYGSLWHHPESFVFEICSLGGFYMDQVEDALSLFKERYS
jgi:hypothetical protein